ncbi:MAG TPA: hypothetical protein VF742_15040 [Terracidiphilus sp.]|jgi:hypothetical protein
MSEARRSENKETEGRGPNLVLIYGLIALGFLVAMIFAAMIVLPFYHRR